MTARKKESALGRGLDALIRTDLTDEKKSDDETENNEVSKISTSGSRRKSNTNSSTTKSNDNEAKNKKSEDLKTEGKYSKHSRSNLVENVILEVRKNPRISLWSAKSAAVLRLLKKTKPEFSISKEASALIEEAVKDKYPELWEEFEDREI